MPSSLTLRSVAALIVASLAIRASVLASDWDSLQLDPDSYARLAVNWANSGIYGFEARPPDVSVRPTAYRPPLYPWVLSWLVQDGSLNTLGVAALHILLGVATVLLVYVVAVRLAVRWPILPSLAVACDPILLRGSQLVMTETLVTFLAAAAWAVWLGLMPPADAALDGQVHRAAGANRDADSGSWLGGLWLGALFGLSVLTRPTMLPWAALSMLLLPTCRWRAAKRLVVFAVAGLVFIALLLPWTVRNVRQFGRPILTTTHGGYTLLLANNPLLYQHFKESGPSRDWEAERFHKHWAARATGDPADQQFWFRNLHKTPVEPAIRELEDDRLAQQAAIATIRRQPSMFFTSCLIRVGWLWALAPNEGSWWPSLAIGIWYAAWFVVALAGAWRLGTDWLSPGWLMPAALLITLTGIHAIYWSNMRMRAPMMPVVYVVAALALRMKSEGQDDPSTDHPDD